MPDKALVDPLDDPETARRLLSSGGAPQQAVPTAASGESGLVDPLDDPATARRLLQPSGSPMVPTETGGAMTFHEDVPQAPPTFADRVFGAFDTVKTMAGFGEDQRPELVSEVARRLRELPGSTLTGAVGLREDMPAEQANEKKRLQAILTAATLPTSLPGQEKALAKHGIMLDVEDDGTVVAELDGERYPLNRAGISQADVLDIVNDIAVEAPLAVPFAKGGQMLARIPGRVVGTGTGVAVGSAARDMLAGVPPDIATAGVKGLLAGGIEALPIVGKIIRKAVNVKGLINKADNTLTQAGRKFFERAGIDPDDLTPNVVSKFDEVAKKADDAAAAARVSEAESLPVPVKLTRGDATQNPMQQGLEDAARKGAFGEDLQQRVTGFRSTQDEALQANRSAIQSGLGGGAQVERLQGVEAAQRTLAGNRDALKTATDEAYRAARQTSAAVETGGVKSVGKAARRALAQEFNPATAPKAFRLAGELQNIDKRFPGKVTRVKINALEQWRQQVSSLARSNDAVERAAAKKLVRVYDDALDSTIDDALISGDPGALDAFKQARGLRRELAKRFESDKLIAKIIDAEDGTLLLEPSEASNVLFTVSGLGGKRGAVKALRTIKNELGEDSAEWAALRQDAFLRLFDNQGRGRFSGSKFATSLNKTLRDSPELIKELFSPDEIALIRRFRNVALNATERSADAPINFSNTAILGRVLDNMGFLGRQANGLLKAFLRGSSPEAVAVEGGLRNALRGPVSAPLPGVTGVVGATAVDQATNK